MQERNHIDLRRRRWVITLAAACATLAAARRVPHGDVAAPWDVAADRPLRLRRGEMFDLNLTLPRAVPRGGVFAVDPAGAPLPPGIALSRSGQLTVAATAAGSVSGVIFRYTAPA